MELWQNLQHVDALPFAVGLAVLLDLHPAEMLQCMDRSRTRPTGDDALVEVAERGSERSLVVGSKDLVEIGQRGEMFEERLIVDEIFIAKPQLHVGEDVSQGRGVIVGDDVKDGPCVGIEQGVFDVRVEGQPGADRDEMEESAGEVIANANVIETEGIVR